MFLFHFYLLYILHLPFIFLPPLSMETMTATQPKTTSAWLIRLETCTNVQDVAMISVDNTQTFENKDLNELYVTGWEQVAQATKNIMQACAYYGITLVNVIEEHPLGHISLAANYKDKNVYDLITYEEVKDWTEENNGIWERAQFTLGELKRFLSEVESQRLWPDHGIVDTQWVELTQPLQESDFDVKIIKWTNPAREAYSGFDETKLHEELTKREKKIVLIWWVATDYCVGNTALGAIKNGYEVYLINDAIKWVAQDTTDTMIKTLKGEGVRFISSQELFQILDQ